MGRDKPCDPPTTQVMLGVKACTMGTKHFTLIVTMGVLISLYGKEELDMKRKCAYLEIQNKEDERKWKEFLKTYFPNHYAKGLLNDDLVIENPDKSHNLKIIGVNEDGYGYLAIRCLLEAKSITYIKVKDFEEFTQLDIYKNIINRGPIASKGEPRIVY